MKVLTCRCCGRRWEYDPDRLPPDNFVVHRAREHAADCAIRVMEVRA